MSALDVQVDLVEALLLRFLREELGAAGLSRAVIGLSGGVDSAVSAALAARALGPDAVLGVLMPYRSSNPDSVGDARLLAADLGIETREIEISEMADAYFGVAQVEDPTRRGNVMARCRMTILYDLSVEWRGLVIGTSNKTEMLLGYSTQFGDGAHAVNPLGDLYKHQVFQLARHLGVRASIVEKPPSADLFEGQTDEDDLGFSYAHADAVLYSMVDQRWNREELLAAGHAPQVVDAIARRVVRNQYKRLPPVIAKLSERTINQDFRYLRDWHA
ncbi:NAD+ synthase [Engelhardtia mirabilis]|uniref:NH(3)-dependent NAD(+) synthetase n=1 Tax=Engelhardtia mirabilis TaxID=2528011 RepID=A0A518BDN4_9BACT|nr:NH(3)-dependent NAD(+) synthetase [Planctomycetes bacterium Pla133]QDU99329.1 NH(3)-dependent NAD(+) synthetase [Planctomycetes bacterium Pla86]